MQLRIILCMPEDLANSLLNHIPNDLNQEPIFSSILHPLEESESDIYKRLETLAQVYDKEDAVLVICDSLGSRSCTLALSMTHDHVSVITGCNLDMLHALPSVYQKSKALDYDAMELLSYCGDLLYRSGVEGICLSHTYLRELGEESSIYSSLNESLIADSRFS